MLGIDERPVKEKTKKSKKSSKKRRKDEEDEDDVDDDEDDELIKKRRDRVFPPEPTVDVSFLNVSS